MEAPAISLIQAQSALSRFERAAESVIEKKLDTLLDRLQTERREFGWVTNEQAMILLGLSRATLARYRADGTLPYAKPFGQDVYYRVADIEALMERSVVGRTGEAA